ncbi:MAG: hypothetical protein AAGF12_24320 [Myxococcota bacterium]
MAERFRWVVGALALAACGCSTTVDAGTVTGDRAAGPRAIPAGEQARRMNEADSPGFAGCTNTEGPLCAESCGGEVPSCCLGSGTCCGAAPELQTLLPAGARDGLAFDSCTGDLEGCFPDIEVFGSPRPWVDQQDGKLRPGGREFDSGLLIGKPVDLRISKITLEASLGRAGEDCDAGCVDSAGFGFTGQDSLGTASQVSPLAALLLSGSRDEVMLVIGEQTIARWPMVDATERWRLVFTPNGQLEVWRNGAVVTRSAFTLHEAARLLVYGRSRNRGAELSGSGIGDLAVHVELCDMPDRWFERGPMAVDRPLSELRDPSVSTAEGETLVAFSAPDGIHVGEVSDDFQSVSLLVQDVPALVPTVDHNRRGVEDPELFVHEGWTMLYTATGESGTRSIAIARRGADNRFEADPRPAIAPEEYGFVHLSQPSIARAIGERWVVVAVAEDGNGLRYLALFYSDDLERFDWFPSAELTELTRRKVEPTMTSLDFDAHEIAAPALHIQNGAYHLYYGGRNGLRWSIGVLVSDDLRFWRRLESPVLEGADTPEERIGVRGPDAFFSDGAVHLVYDAEGSVDARLGHATRPATGHLESR